jgi:membrane protein DedA with SNARE-associated domain
MSNWLPCLYATALIAIGSAVSAVAGYWLGRWREQLWLLEIFKPER